MRLVTLEIFQKNNFCNKFKTKKIISQKNIYRQRSNSFENYQIEKYKREIKELKLNKKKDAETIDKLKNKNTELTDKKNALLEEMDNYKMEIDQLRLNLAISQSKEHPALNINQLKNFETE